MEKIITELVDSIVVNKNAKGYTYLKEAIEIAARDMEKTENLSRDIYGPIAEKHNVTTNAVQQAIGRTIAHTWEHGNKEGLQRICGGMIDRPTHYDLILYMGDKVYLMSKEANLPIGSLLDLLLNEYS